ncbi:hypothetical protein [Neptuniibacter sp. QD37_11]|uniref:hypothetical protein n=1 Tax=Neptuniibacter sp. QD37_11 TaxID=3398209 RepID=UPI0039F5BC5D
MSITLQAEFKSQTAAKAAKAYFSELLSREAPVWVTLLSELRARCDDINNNPESKSKYLKPVEGELSIDQYCRIFPKDMPNTLTMEPCSESISGEQFQKTFEYLLANKAELVKITNPTYAFSKVPGSLKDKKHLLSLGPLCDSPLTGTIPQAEEQRIASERIPTVLTNPNGNVFQFELVPDLEGDIPTLKADGSVTVVTMPHLSDAANTTRVGARYCEFVGKASQLHPLVIMAVVYPEIFEFTDIESLLQSQNALPSQDDCKVIIETELQRCKELKVRYKLKGFAPNKRAIIKQNKVHPEAHKDLMEVICGLLYEGHHKPEKAIRKLVERKWWQQ